jgi:hypothetical protein
MGFRLTFAGSLSKEEIELFTRESREVLKACSGGFGVVVDMRNLQTLSPEAKAALGKGQAVYQAKGLRCSAVLLQDSIVTLQLVRISRESGVYAFERYIDVSSDPLWKKHADDWVRSGIDPYKLEANARGAGSGS